MSNETQGANSLVARLADWLASRPGLEAPIEAAAEHFGVTAETIRDAVDCGYWLGLVKYPHGEVVFVDGE